MKVGIPRWGIFFLMVLPLLSFFLVSCSNKNHSYSAPISEINTKKLNITCDNTIISIQSSKNALSSKKNSMKKNNLVYNRQYNNIQKGSYAGGNTYTVKPGDTLFYIAWITKNDLIDLAKKNNIVFPYTLSIGQILNLDDSVNSSSFYTDKNVKQYIKKENRIINSSSSTHSSIIKLNKFNRKLIKKIDVSCKDNHSKKIIKNHIVSHPLPILWHWPTKGKIIDSFSLLDGGNKGIDISGNKGQAIVATADGRVVYAGNALRGYGNLIIIKHNNDYLSAYAHNDTILVREQEYVKVSQKIATMGSSGTNSTRLHFEIRYKGKSVNPLKYLPKR